jgi:hypothetical protein
VAVPAGGKLLPAGACRPPLRAEDEELTPSPPLPPAAGAPKQKTSRWHAPSKGLASRVKRQDAAHEEADRRLGKVDRATLETSQAALERKARIYDELKRGGTGGLSERQLKEAAVDVRPTVAPRLSSLAG